MWTLRRGGCRKTDTGPEVVDPLSVLHPVEFKDGHPTDASQYNTATAFQIRATFADGKQIEMRHDGDNGILFEGTEGRIFVNRGRLTGKAVDELKSKSAPRWRAGASLQKPPSGRSLSQPSSEAATDRKEPISDVFSHHRALSTCHLAGIAARLGRKLRWNPQSETIVGDQQAQGFVARQPRKGFEIEA